MYAQPIGQFLGTDVPLHCTRCVFLVDTPFHLFLFLGCRMPACLDCKTEARRPSRDVACCWPTGHRAGGFWCQKNITRERDGCARSQVPRLEEEE